MGEIKALVIFALFLKVRIMHLISPVFRNEVRMVAGVR